MPIEHDRASWYTQKLTDPRSFDVRRVKTPEELLKMPNFTFKPADVQAITMVLTSMVKDRVPQEMREQLPAAVIAGRQLIDEKNCKGCHRIEQMGGDIRGFLKGQQALWPPDLNTEGFKTQPSWLMKFVKDPSTVRIRPFLDARMPTFHFTEKEVDTITAYFSALDKVDYPLISTVVDTTPEKLRVGAELFNTLQCGKCHPTGSSNPTKPPKDWAPNLNLVQTRLRPEWLLGWLKDPQVIFPGAGMPGSFPDFPKSSVKDVYDGSAAAQIEALRDHIFVTLGGGQKSATASN
jgi:cytochrome c2